MTVISLYSGKTNLKCEINKKRGFKMTLPHKAKYDRAFKALLKDSKADIETSHTKADKMLCDLLIELGYKSVVDKYEKVPKWYA